MKIILFFQILNFWQKKQIEVEVHKAKLELYENLVLPTLKANALSVVTISLIHLLKSYIQLRDEEFPKAEVKSWDDFHLKLLCDRISNKIEVRNSNHFKN